MGVIISRLPEQPLSGRRLGRHVEHDSASRAFAAGTAAPRTVRYERYCPPFDQGELGSCTGNAMAGALMTGSYHVAGRTLTEQDAIALYEAATKLDDVPGSYPPEDTGSSGLAVAKAAVERGYLHGYAHAFGLDHALGALSLNPCIAGVAWYDSFDNPLPTGECPLTPGAKVRGGHEVELVGLDVENQRVFAVNSWGPVWGGLKDGTFWWSFDTFGRLLQQNGDVTSFRL